MTTHDRSPIWWAAVTALIAVTGIITTVGVAMIYGLTSRVDALYADGGSVKASVAATATDMGYVKQDISEIKQTLKEMSVTLQSIDRKLSLAEIQPKKIDWLVVKEPQVFFKAVATTKIPGPIYVWSDDEKINDYIKTFERQ